MASSTSAMTFTVSPFFAADASMMARHAKPPATTSPAASAVTPIVFWNPPGPITLSGPIPFPIPLEDRELFEFLHDDALARSMPSSLREPRG